LHLPNSFLHIYLADSRAPSVIPLLPHPTFRSEPVSSPSTRSARMRAPAPTTLPSLRSLSSRVPA
jgi:hypothetical protein